MPPDCLKISLRNYNKVIKKLISIGQFSDSILHCRHILQNYPKHVDTYRQLGETFLELERYPEAADVFKRVLSAVPDDFVAHLGLSVINEYHKNLDEAIWHMLRAFDSRPSFSAIKDELQRLYGLRDGIEPKEVFLTRSALARLYLRGGMYPQAIVELEAILVDQPERVDILVLLANTYLLNGQISLSITSATEILRKLPYCLAANRILAFSLNDSDLEISRSTCKQRLVELDPYYQFISQVQEDSSNVPDETVTLRWLDGYPAPEEAFEWSSEAENEIDTPPGDATTTINSPDDKE